MTRSLFGQHQEGTPEETPKDGAIITPNQHISINGYPTALIVDRLLGEGGLFRAWLMRAIGAQEGTEDQRPSDFSVLRKLIGDTGNTEGLKSRTEKESNAMRARLTRPDIPASVLTTPLIPEILEPTETAGLLTLYTYAQGRTVVEVVKKRIHTPLLKYSHRQYLQDVWEIIGRIAHTVGVISGAGLNHRDVKPANATESGTLFDNSLLCVREEFNRKLTGTPNHYSMHAGTPRYMSPEVASCQAINDRSDWFSLGIMALELAGGMRALKTIGAASRLVPTIVRNRAFASLLCDHARVRSEVLSLANEMYDESSRWYAERLLALGTQCVRRDYGARPESGFHAAQILHDQPRPIHYAGPVRFSRLPNMLPMP